MKRKSSIFRRTLASILIPEILAFFTLMTFSLFFTVQFISQITHLQENSIEREIKSTLEFQDLALNFIEKSMDEKIISFTRSINNEYERNHSSITSNDLNLIKEKIGMSILDEIYVIDSSGIIVNTTYKPDLNRNMYDFGEEYEKFLINIRLNTSLNVERFSVEAETKRLKKYAYQGTKDHLYIFEIGSYSSNADSAFIKLRKNVENIVSGNSKLIDLDIIIGKNNSIGFINNFNYNKDSIYIKHVHKTKRDTIIKYPEQKKRRTYRYISRNSNLYSSAVLMFEVDYGWEDKLFKEKFSVELLTIFLVLIILITIVFFNTKNITKPIISLTDKAKLITSGNLNERVEIKGANEISVLSHHFNEMVEQLQENQSQLSQSNKELAAQRDEIEIQKEIVEEAHQEIKDSINYAKRIQNAILPSNYTFNQHLSESFVLYKPKDIVAGDFYWLEQVEDTLLFAAADCTGHGVPGAMVSVVCHNAMNRAVREFGFTKPGLILDKTRELVITEFEKSEDDVKDGMDIALCSINGNILQYSGAHNPLWVVRENKLIETKGDKQPIGKFDNPLPYSTHSIELKKGDSIYIFTDGYADQFGGVRDKKFGSKQMKELLISIQEKSMEEQKEVLKSTLQNWITQGNDEQIDDICIMGVKIS